VSVYGGSDPATAPARTIRRLGHLPAVPTAYANRNLSTESVETIRAQAAREGYDDGYDDGLARAAEEAARRRDEESALIAQAVAALRAAAAAVQGEESRLRAELHAAAPGLAFAILEVLVARDSALMADPVREAITRALALDDGMRSAKIRLHPLDVATLGDLDLGRDAAVIADAAVAPGGALVEVGEAVLDGQLDSALERVRRVLLGPADPVAAQ
jgi:flagellar assembly protein FliH